ncbi:LysR family hydrogen peroxide-inducible transcriptional activator [Roseivirga ehrenbergii]|uniref:LysR family transcriptional regulator n=1 Tax=Roseivirga ehrenbergii (strain DSM 102268 / JCM 13514 / KCTC 12282 / NCIMB 14502 / KMM 6017) TaxID=279360 RepID=A0A150WYV0_ROSEK|nr:hydrogen peroxide-inducible genes activator [Roseivirga ehrenbergii]KYG71647.1 LysR family transcriptional regulator [Roseivirga ehrenbergii]TCL07664.1 LysR family hydrogen peroxide-inducible transcriptional activator [Roseivirga ehrenbergii]
MTLQQLEYIVALDTHRHFVTAASHCFVTQPTLTLQVQKLEDEMNTLIFDRSRHPIVPTPTGELIINKARQILREAHQLKELVNLEKDTITGSFRIAVIPTVAPYLMPRFLKSFSEKHPNTHLQIREMESEEIIHALKNDFVDIGILATPLEESSIREIPLYNEPFLIYSSENHSLYGKSNIKPDSLPLYGLWLLNQGHCFRNQVLNICDKKKQSNNPGFSYESGSIETLKNMVRSNMGYTLVPELSVIDELDDPRVKRLESPEPIREISLVVHKSFTKESLIEKLREEILSNIPDHFQKGKKFIKVKWR